MTKLKIPLIALTVASCGWLAVPAPAADNVGEVSLILEHHQFVPDVIRVKARTPAVLAIENKDGSVEEFDSTSLRIEKIIPAGKTVRIKLPALPAGTYEFIGEYHETTAKGRVVAE